MTVSELIAFLQTQPQDIQVAIEMYSEQMILSAEDIKLIVACAPRPDGWVQHDRPDLPRQQYILFPGN